MLRPQSIRVSQHTPANPRWTLSFSYANASSNNPRSINITFLPTGDIDFDITRREDLDTANTILAPTINIIHTQSPNVDIWRLLNWLYVSYYWMFLRDLGQTFPTTYVAVRESDRANFSLPTRHNTTNNIFVNETLFQIYATYLNETFLPILKMSVDFEPPSKKNSLKLITTTFIRSYSCIERQLKPVVTVIFSVIAVDYSLLAAAYGLVMIFAGMCQKKRTDGTSFFNLPDC